MRAEGRRNIGAYNPTMSEPAGGVVLVDEAVDVTTNEAHFRLIALLHMALSYALDGQAAVLADIFLRVDNREQVAPDVLIAMGSSAGTRSMTVRRVSMVVP